MGWYGKLMARSWARSSGAACSARSWACSRPPVRPAHRQWRFRGRQQPPRDQPAFFRATFQVMGHVAKADGRVSEQEIEAARAVMRRFRWARKTSGAQSISSPRASRLISPLDSVLADLRASPAAAGDLLRMFLEIQLEASMLGSGSMPPARAIRPDVRRTGRLGGRVRGARGAAAHACRAATGRGSRGRSSPAAHRRGSRTPTGFSACARMPATREVKRAYRRLMSQHHPDKLSANGLPESMLEARQAAHAQIRAPTSRYVTAAAMK